MTAAKPKRIARTWPVLLLTLPAFVAIWGGWVELGGMTGFGVINLLPGMVAFGSWATLNTAITLPIGLETYAAYALHVYMNATQKGPLRRFAGWSALGSLILGGGGQVGYHVMESMGMERAPIWVTAVVGSLPVLVLGMGTTLAALVKRAEAGQESEAPAKRQTLVQRVASVRALGEDLKYAVTRPVPKVDPIGAVPAPYLSEDPQGPEVLVLPDPEPAPKIPAPRSPRTPVLRGQWDVAKAVRLLLDGEKDLDVAATVGIGPKAIQRTRRALQAIKADPQAVIPQDWKVPVAVVQVIREEVRALN